MARNLSALIIDPNPDSCLDAAQSVEVIGLDAAGEGSYGTESTVLAAELKPNVVLLALEEPPVRALSTLESLQQMIPDTPVLVYSSSGDVELVRQAMRWGARDYLTKPLRPEDLRDAIHTVLAQEEQRQLARWGDVAVAGARGTVITVAGAKGGIGKSTVSVNLAIALRQVTGQEVALVDGDAQFVDLSVMLDLDVQHSIADLARNEAEINRTTISEYLTRHRSGIDVLMAASEPDDWRALQPEHISAIARALSETHEFVVFDTPGTMNEVVAASLNEASIVLLMTSLDISSVKDTRTALRIFDAWAFPRGRVRLCVNDNNRAVAVTPDDVAQVTETEITQHFLYDRDVGFAVQSGVPIVEAQPNSKFAKACRSLGESIAGVRPSDKAAQRSGFARVPLLGRISA